MALADFQFVMRFRVPYHDIDMLQHVNNAAYVVWLETVRCNYFDEVLGGSLTGAKSMIVARLEMNYEHPLDYREDVAIGCRVSRIGRKSFDVAFEIWSETRHQLAVYGFSTMVAYDYNSKSSKAFPDDWREIIETYELVAPAI
jgi:acyl-CoA thioester hydrolase